MEKWKMNGAGRFTPKNGIPINGFFSDGIRVDINNNMNNNINNSQNINKDNIRF